MTTHKRIKGDYQITTITAGNSITLDTDVVSVTGNLDVSGAINAASNYVTTGNITANNISAQTVSAGFFFGDGQYLSNVIANVGGASILQKGLTNVNIPVANGAVQIQINGVANVAVIDSSGIVTGDITTGNLTVNTIRSDDSSVVDIDDGVRIQNSLEVFGNASANYFLGNGALLTGVITSVSGISNGTSDMTVISPGGNIQANIAGNTVLVLSSTGANVTGNITGSYILGNGSQLTGIDATSIQNGTSNVRVVSSGGNVTASVGGTANVVVITSTGANISGTISGRGSLTLGNTSTGNSIWSVQDQSGTIVQEYGRQDGTASSPAFDFHSGATATDYDARIQATGGTGVTGQGNLSLQAANFNITATTAVTGNISASNLSVSTGTITTGNIVNGAGNGVGNIGSESTYFNTVFAKATSAQYADLAENYLADQEYTPGTVVVFGGEKEITTTTVRADARVAGAISTNPAYLMNAQAPGLAVALRGRIPVRVTGPVNKGDGLVTSDTAGFAESIRTDRTYGQSVFAKSLETNLEPGEKTIIAIIL